MPNERRISKSRKEQSEDAGWYLSKARKFISKGSFKSAEKELERLLELDPEHQQAQVLLMEIRREEELSARGASPPTSSFGKKSAPIPVEVESREVRVPSREKESTAPKQNDERKGQTGSEAGFSSEQETISAQASAEASVEDATPRHEEGGLSPSEETSQEEDAAKNLEPATWLKWETTERGRPATEELFILLSYVNPWPREVRFQQANIDYPSGMWPPGITELPRRRLEPGQKVGFHRLRVRSGQHRYHVEVFAVEDAATKVMRATLEITVSNEQPPKVELVE